MKGNPLGQFMVNNRTPVAPLGSISHQHPSAMAGSRCIGAKMLISVTLSRNARYSNLACVVKSSKVQTDQVHRAKGQQIHADGYFRLRDPQDPGGIYGRP